MDLEHAARRGFTEPGGAPVRPPRGPRSPRLLDFPGKRGFSDLRSGGVEQLLAANGSRWLPVSLGFRCDALRSRMRPADRAVLAAATLRPRHTIGIAQVRAAVRLYG